MQINTEYRSEFARCLEPLLLLGQRRSLSTTGSTSLGLASASGLWVLLQLVTFTVSSRILLYIRMYSIKHSSLLHRLQSSLSVQCHSPAMSDMSLCSSVVRKPSSHRYISTKVLLAEGEETPFMEHCCSYENSYRVRGTAFLKPS